MVWGICVGPWIALLFAGGGPARPQKPVVLLWSHERGDAQTDGVGMLVTSGCSCCQSVWGGFGWFWDGFRVVLSGAVSPKERGVIPGCV